MPRLRLRRMITIGKSGCLQRIEQATRFTPPGRRSRPQLPRGATEARARWATLGLLGPATTLTGGGTRCKQLISRSAALRATTGRLPQHRASTRTTRTTLLWCCEETPSARWLAGSSGSQALAGCTKPKRKIGRWRGGLLITAWAPGRVPSVFPSRRRHRRPRCFRLPTPPRTASFRQRKPPPKRWTCARAQQKGLRNPLLLRAMSALCLLPTPTCLRPPATPPTTLRTGPQQTVPLARRSSCHHAWRTRLRGGRATRQSPAAGPLRLPPESP